MSIYFEFFDREWEIKHSSFAKLKQGEATYSECRKFACRDIAKNTTKIPKRKVPFVIDIPKGTDFHFIGRVDTSDKGSNHVKSYFQSFKYRTYISFSTVNKKNISTYNGRLFFIYNICAEDIVHIFPTDSDTDIYAKSEKMLTAFPSLWITLKELEDLQNKFGTYSQVTCKTHRRGNIIKPVAVLAIDNVSSYVKKIAEEFEVGIVVIHPDDDAINYKKDLLNDYEKIDSISDEFRKYYKDINYRYLLLRSTD